MFAFTSTRSTFFKPAKLAILLRKRLLKELHEQTGIEIPFNRSNIFMLDNEGLRFLPAYKQGIKFIMDEKQVLDESWRKSVEEIHRLVIKILECDPHAVQDTISFNEVEQLIH